MLLPGAQWWALSSSGEVEVGTNIASGRSGQLL